MGNRQVKTQPWTAAFGLRLAMTIALAGALLLLAGCVAFSGTDIKKVDPFPQAQEPKKSVRLNLTYKQRLNDEAVDDLDGVVEQKLQTKAIDAFTSSGLF